MKTFSVFMICVYFCAITGAGYFEIASERTATTDFSLMIQDLPSLESGSLSTDNNQLVTNDAWARSNSTFTWSVTPNADGTNTYHYVLGIGNPVPKIVIIEAFGPMPGKQTWASGSIGRLPRDIEGLSFVETKEITIISEYGPAWGSFFANRAISDGINIFNSGLEGGNDFIAVPGDQIYTVPEPATFALLALGLLVIRRKR